MGFRWRRELVAWSFVCAVALVVTGCHKDSVPATSASPSPSPGPSESVLPSASPTAGGGITASTTLTLVSSGGSQTLSSEGLSGTLTYPSFTPASGVTAEYVLTTNEPDLPALPPTGTPFVYGEFVLGSTATFTGDFGFSALTIPTSVITLSSSNVIQETIYDGISGAQIGATVTGTLTGQSVTFGSPGTSSFPASAFDTYYLVITYQ